MNAVLVFIASEESILLCHMVASEESILLSHMVASEEIIFLSHMGPPKSAIKSLILVVEQFCTEIFFILFQF